MKKRFNIFNITFIIALIVNLLNDITRMNVAGESMDVILKVSLIHLLNAVISLTIWFLVDDKMKKYAHKEGKINLKAYIVHNVIIMLIYIVSGAIYLEYNYQADAYGGASTHLLELSMVSCATIIIVIIATVIYVNYKRKQELININVS